MDKKSTFICKSATEEIAIELGITRTAEEKKSSEEMQKMLEDCHNNLSIAAI